MLLWLCDSYFKSKSRICKGAWGTKNDGNLSNGWENLDVILKLLISKKIFHRNATLERLSLDNKLITVMKNVFSVRSSLPLLSLAIRTKTSNGG